jgi:predicted metal-dependent HD superfamily phosphohydrolase
MSSFGVADHPEMFERITKAYAETHRRYHTAAHINACLREFDSVRSLARSGPEVEAALWFHDVIYNTRASDNELQSAEMASRFLTSSGVSSQRFGPRNNALLTMMVPSLREQLEAAARS